jgi:hypothetical protein
MLHRSEDNHTRQRRRANVLHDSDTRSRWLNDPKAKKPLLLVTGRE